MIFIVFFSTYLHVLLGICSVCTLYVCATIMPGCRTTKTQQTCTLTYTKKDKHVEYYFFLVTLRDYGFSVLVDAWRSYPTGFHFFFLFSSSAHSCRKTKGWRKKKRQKSLQSEKVETLRSGSSNGLFKTKKSISSFAHRSDIDKKYIFHRGFHRFFLLGNEDV